MKLYFAILTSLAALPGICHAQDAPSLDTINAITAKYIKHLTTNAKYTYAKKSYGDIEFGKLFGTDNGEAYFGETVGMHKVSGTWLGKKDDKDYCQWKNADRITFVNRKSDNQSEIRYDHVAWANDSGSYQFASFLRPLELSEIVFPVSATAYGLSLNEYCVPFREQTIILSIANSEYRSAKCLLIATKPDPKVSGLRVETDYYLHPETGMVLAKRQKKMMSMQKGQIGMRDIDQLTEISYGPTENGLPFPKAIKGWFIWPDGKREPMTDVEFTEYKRYTPTADELDFEKTFGIQLPALPPKPLAKPGTFSKVGRWLLIAFGVAASATIAIAVVRRRRRIVA